jgi:hypothetical protein
LPPLCGPVERRPQGRSWRRQGWWLGDFLTQGGRRKAEFFIFEYDELNRWAPVLLEQMRGLPQLADVASDQQSAGPTLKIVVNRDVASRLGVDPAYVDSILYSASGVWRGFTPP